MNLLPRLALRFDRGRAHTLKVLAHEDQLCSLRGIREDAMVLLHRKRPTGYGRLLWEFVNMSKVAKKNNTHVLYHPYQIGSLPNGIKSILMLSNMEPFRFQSYSYTKSNWIRNVLLRQYSKKCLREADRVIAISNFTENVLIKEVQIKRSQITRIYNGRNDDFRPSIDVSADREVISSELGIDTDFILSPGSLLPYRRTEDVILAYASVLAHNNSPIKLIIAGAALDKHYYNNLIAIAGQRGLSGNVRFIGHVSIGTMKALYRLCRMCIIASEVEACPTIAIEAMASGCAIICSDREPMPEMLDGCGMIYPARNKGILTEHMKRCLEDISFIAELKQRAVHRSDFFSWDKCADETFRALTTF